MTPEGGSTPPLVTPLVPPPDPPAVCARLAGLPNRVFLDSAMSHAERGRYSFVAADPWTLITAATPEPFAALRAALRGRRTRRVPELPPFQGGAIGYLAYEFGHRLERLPRPRADDLGLPDLWFGLYDWVIAWDHAAARAWLISTGLPAEGTAAARRAAARRDMVLDRLGSQPAAHLRIPAPRPSAPVVAADLPTVPVAALGNDVHSVTTERQYYHAVQRIREHITAGDVFQVNLTHRLSAPLWHDPFTFYERLRRVNPAPFAAYLEPGDWAVASASPERFVQLDAAGRVETRPIKGTRPRRADPAEDAAQAADLLASAKDRAENVMIVDLLRNDLSRVCAPGSVAVPELCVLEQFATVHHLVSTVVGQLTRGCDALDLIAAAFPGGSITGAPKIRAMEIIRDLEPVARGVYCGAIGYWSVTGALDTSVAIRTCTVRHGRLHFGVGGGITTDSDPVLEYAETLDKARGIVAALTAP